jgi:3'-phosphoadenosine 5'-phosphosulfate sulfotransferase (PAPS reductase)/FAD synthetase
MALTHSDYSLSQLDVLEAESIHIMREVAAEFERPVLFSGGRTRSSARAHRTGVLSARIASRSCT